MAEAGKFEFENSELDLGDEDQQTLDAIDEGLADAESGRTLPAEAARECLVRIITSSTHKGR